MKRCLAVLFSVLFCFGVACAPQRATVQSNGMGERNEYDAQTIAAAVMESQVGGEELARLSGDILSGYLASLGLTGWEDAFVLTGQGMDAREITILRLKDAVAAKQAAQCLEDHRRARMGDFFGYAPEQTALLEDALVLTRADCAAFLACVDMEAAKAAFSACFDGGVTEHTLAPTPKPTPGSAPDSEIPLESFPLNPDLDISGFVPYRQPGDVDMTVYDHSAVVTAWNTGDESDLSDMDRAILVRCRAAFAEVVRDDMTDAEVELALHDWLMANGRYDDLSRDNVAHIGRPNNTDPYGMLVEGYGICLGFSATFQLLMDLAGIECITVIGAAYESTADHAWNMVRLDGDWYCVDVTWNNSYEDIGGPEKTAHKYFNVTSAVLRANDHQWDYRNVPEATVDVYRWDNVK